jgi:hypothetical protein
MELAALEPLLIATSPPLLAKLFGVRPDCH